MRIITLWQPWASLVALGLKRFETRSWGTQYRGKLAIHAAKRPMRGDFSGSPLVLRVREATGKNLEYELGSRCWWPELFPLGQILAVCDLTNCQMMNLSEVGEEKDPYFAWIDDQSELELMMGDWQPGRYAWELSKVMTLTEPIWYRGGPGLRKLDDHATLMSIAARLPMGGEA